MQLPPCPIKAGVSISNTTTVTLPATSPVPLKIKAAGKISFIDETGATTVDVDVNVAQS